MFMKGDKTMFYVPPCMRSANDNKYIDYITDENRLPNGVLQPPPLPPECQGIQEQPNSVKYYFLNYCYRNKCKCFICFKPPTTLGEGLPPPNTWLPILKMEGTANSFNITIPILLVPFTFSNDKIIAVKISYAPLKLYWSSARGDYFTTATSTGDSDASAAKYIPIEVEGFVYPYQAIGTVPLKLYWSSARGDNFTTATSKGEMDAIAAGYKFARIEGYIYPSYIAGTIPLKLFWNSERGDNFTTATKKGEADAIAAGYKFVRVEGYILPN